MTRPCTSAWLIGTLLATTLATASSARADGDPASDVLVYQRVFIPDDAPVSPGAAARVFGVVRVASTDGYRIRVALIGSPRDMGAASALWGKPQPYARFLGAELRFAYGGILLVVMPNGFGFSHSGHPVAAEGALLRRIGVARGANGLTRSAVDAVTELARTAGAPLDPADLERATSRAMRILRARQPMKVQPATPPHVVGDGRRLPAWVIFGVLAFGLLTMAAAFWKIVRDMRRTR